MVIRERHNENFFTLIRRSPAKTCGIYKKWSASNHALVQSFRWPFQCSTTFQSNTFQKLAFGHVRKRILFSKLCKFFVFDDRYLFTNVHCHSACSVSLFRGVFVNKKRNPQLLQCFPELESALLSSNRNCVMREAHFHQMSHTYHLRQCVHFHFSHYSCETFDIESKANPNYLHRWEYIREAR